MAIFVTITTIVLILIVAFFQSKNLKRDLLSILFNILLVILGFSLALLWETIKSEGEARKEAEAIVNMLRLETSQNFGATENNIRNLEKNLKAINPTSDLQFILNPLESSVWESVKLRNKLFIENTGDLFQIVNFYTLVSIVNNQIQVRENFINSNYRGKEYLERLKLIDLNLLEKSKQLKQLNHLVQSFLFSLPPQKLEGYSFEYNKGKIEKIEPQTN